ATAALARAEEPATRPSVPALLASSEGTVDFVADGELQTQPRIGWAFHVAKRGDKQVCAVFDLTDGTPIFLSDGSQTIVYDIYNNRAAGYDSSRAKVTIDWKPDEPRPMSIGCGLVIKSDRKKLDAEGSAIRADTFLARANITLKHGETSDFLFAARAD